MQSVLIVFIIDLFTVWLYQNTNTMKGSCQYLSVLVSPALRQSLTHNRFKINNGLMNIATDPTHPSIHTIDPSINPSSHHITGSQELSSPTPLSFFWGQRMTNHLSFICPVDVPYLALCLIVGLIFKNYLLILQAFGTLSFYSLP